MSMEVTHKLIKEIAEDFVYRTYKNDIPDGYCFSLCYPLSVLFSLMGIEHEITYGKTFKKHVQISHFWITFKNDGTILDPTIRQFNQNESSVYYGEINKNETSKKYEIIQNTSDNDFHQTYDSWAEPLFQVKHRRPLPLDLENKLISFNVAAANVLYSHIEKYKLEERLLISEYGLKYFKPINFILRYNYPIDTTNFGLNHIPLKYFDKIKNVIDIV